MTLTKIAIIDKKLFPFSIDENSTNCLLKNPIKGGIPAIENKHIVKQILNKGLAKNWPFNSDIYLISLSVPLYNLATGKEFLII